MDDQYDLRYLPLFYQDMHETVTYISDELLNPNAANDLIDEVENAILERLPFCESFEQYHSIKERKYPYYRIYVKKYVIFYVVISEGNHKIMEVRRLLHAYQDRDSII
ncbi:type II toxin-antitoxin system RelE/ParE family toxin [Eubacterium xylanophilum]|uniref:type II toxin-antitoxin system RelE/ParE family toxin n=1 Tax=Eubacterium xylanophilum TaxID=39497 RepID=UPI00047D2CEB|nr:type II toxin-antitoxin system RelE/ParE family toxin [Eubacterium xylanophilum]